MWDASRRRTAVDLSPHTGMDGRYPEDRDVTLNVSPNAWVPAFPARATGTNRIGCNYFNAVGGIADALSSHGNEILASLSPKKELTAETVVDISHEALIRQWGRRFPSSLANQSLRHALDLMPRPLTTIAGPPG
jgi:hypothetical protein